MTFMIRILSALLVVLLSSTAWADWGLETGVSSVNFVSIKKGVVGEVHQFNALSGAIKASGEFELSIDLKSVDTGIEIRDQRMQEHLFAVSQFPMAKISGLVDPVMLKKLKLKKPTQVSVDLSIDLHGHKVIKTATLTVVKLHKKQIMVVSAKPLVITAKDFGLSQGVEKLKQLAGLPSIAEAVPVTVSLLFAKK